MRINLTSLYVDDQRAALAFYVDVLGFTKRRDVPIGDDSWLTVVSPESPDGPELLLEPAGHPAVKPYRDALVEDGIPLAQFAVDDVEAEYARLTGHWAWCSLNHLPTSAPPSLPSSTTRVATSSSSSPRSRTPTSASKAPHVWHAAASPCPRHDSAFMSPVREPTGSPRWRRLGTCESRARRSARLLERAVQPCLDPGVEDVLLSEERDIVIGSHRGGGPSRRSVPRDSGRRSSGAPPVT